MDLWAKLLGYHNMELSDIKTGLIFVLDWSRNTHCCLGEYTKEKLLDINSKVGYKILFLSYSDGKWILNKDRNNPISVFPKKEILSRIESGEWILIRGLEKYKNIPNEFQF